MHPGLRPRRVAVIVDHAVAHEEAVQVDGRGGERDLGQLEHDADLEDEVHAFAAGFALILGGEAGEDGGCKEELGFGEEPLGFGDEEELIREGGGKARWRSGVGGGGALRLRGCGGHCCGGGVWLEVKRSS